MRVTFLAPVADLSGGARVIDIHARALAARGHDVTLVLPPPRPKTLRERLRAVRHGGRWFSDPHPPTHYAGAGYRLVTLDRHRAIGAADVPCGDAVVATWWETAEWMLELPPEAGTKVHFVQGYEAFEPATKPRVDAVLRAPTAKITISGWLLEKLRSELGNERVAMVPNGVDRDQFHAPPRGRRPRFTIGLLYSNKKSKNTVLGLEIERRVRERLGDAALVTFGLHAEQPYLPLPPGTSHTTRPAQDHIRDIYAQCDVWLCASSSEGFHLPPLEAMACRCPVVSTPVGGPLDIIEDGVNGYLYPFDDAAAATERLLSIAALDDDGWRRLSDGAYATAVSCSWEAASAKFEQALLDAVARDREKAAPSRSV